MLINYEMLMLCRRYSKLKMGKNLFTGILAVGFCIPSTLVFADMKVSKDDYTLKTSTVEVSETDKISTAEIKRVLPMIENKEINVKKLSKQIQLINDIGSMNIKAQFIPDESDTYKLNILVEDAKRDSYGISLNNTGDDYTGNWRTSVSYVNRDLSKIGDVLYASYTTSPNHLQDVHQVLLNYRMLLPKLGDSISVGCNYSNSDMGQIADVYGLGLYAKGKSKNIGVHYQHNFKYTKAKKQVLDFGFDYKTSDGVHELRFGDMKWAAGGYKFAENVMAITYTDSNIGKNNFWSYNIGYSQNFKGNSSAYRNYRTNADDVFRIFKAGVTYQHYIPQKWVFVGSLDGQFSNDNLLGTEQFGIGGVSSIRGFKCGAANGDKGYKLTFEAYTPQIIKNSKFVIFTDMGYTFNNKYNIGEMKKSLVSYGVGYRFSDKKGLSMSLDYAKVVKDNGVSSSYRLPWHLNIQKSL